MSKATIAYPDLSGFVRNGFSFFPEDLSTCVKVSDPRVFRNSSRSTILAIHAVNQLLNQGAILNEQCSVYCVTNFGPFDKFSSDLKNQLKRTAPRSFFIQNNGLRAAQIAQNFSLNGSVQVFQSGYNSCFQALEQANFDLTFNFTRQALVVGGLDFEDTLHQSYAFDTTKDLTECGVAILMNKTIRLNSNQQNFQKHGFLTDLVLAAKEINNAS